MSIFRYAIAILTIVASTATARADARVPMGYLVMCVELPEECEAGGPSWIEVTDEIEVALAEINRSVNHSIKPRRDEGGADVWTVDAAAGDCEDYVLAKRHQLIVLGLPPSALRIAYVKTPAQEGHAILVVKTDAEDLVLDNLSSTVEALEDSGYRIISMSGPNPLVWS